MAQLFDLPLGKLQTGTLTNPSLETWTWGPTMAANSRKSGTFMWMPMRSGGSLPGLTETKLLIEPTSVSNAEATTAGKTCNSCQKLTCLSHYERGHITRGATPSRSWQIGYVKLLNPSQGYQCCLSTIYTFPSFLLAVSSHTSVVLETNLRIQQWTDYPTLSSLFSSGPYTLVRQFGHQM